VLEAKTNLQSEIENFAPHEELRHALLLTYNFDGPFIEDPERGLLEALWRRNCTNVLVVRDGKAVLAEKRSHRYRVVNAAYSRQTFHSKLLLVLSSSEVLAAVGSANLTRGGLETNLELTNIYCLTRSLGPHKFFTSLRDYVARLLRLELSGTNTPTRDSANQIVADLDAFLAEASAARSAVEPLLLHNYDETLLPQIVRALPAKRLEMLWIVSPFYEPAPEVGPGEDPHDDILSQSLLETVFKLCSFHRLDGAPPVRFYFQATDKGATLLPLPLLQPWKASIELYRKNPTADDPRVLHGKMLVLAGRAANGRRFVALVHGSANFTRSALLEMPPQGNAELVVLTVFFRPAELAERLAGHLGLDQLFSKVDDWDRLSVRLLPARQPMPSVEVLEAWVSLPDRLVHVAFRASPVAHLLAASILSGAKDNSALLALGNINLPFPQCGEFPLPEAAMITQGPDNGLRQLPYHRIRLEAFDEEGRSIGRSEAALNVDSPEGFYGDWLCSPEESRLENRIFQAGLGAVADYGAMRKYVERVLSASGRGRDQSVPMPSHQADLDRFFRRVHLGFRGVNLRLRQAGGSPYVCRDTLRRLLSRWAQEVAQTDNSYSPEQRLYIADRILRAASDCADAMRRAKRPPATIAPIMREEFLNHALPLANFARELTRDAALQVAARGLLARWSKLQRQHQSRANP
jgi:hypothetical protein